MMKLRDVVISICLLLILLGVLAAVPIVVILISIFGAGFVIYAIIHDTRVKMQNKSEEIKYYDNDGN